MRAITVFVLLAVCASNALAEDDRFKLRVLVNSAVTTPIMVIFGHSMSPMIVRLSIRTTGVFSVTQTSLRV